LHIKLKHSLFYIAFFLTALSSLASRPTAHASNLSFNNLLCTSVNLQWTNGNGAARIIVAKEGSAPDYIPIDFEQYTANNSFGLSIEYGIKNYIVYNSNGTNFVNITNLLPNKTYYFMIYEHDNRGNTTLYYTSGSPSISLTTEYLNLNFSILYIDSCQQKNRYTFTNTSTTSITGVSYTFDFGGGNTSTASPISYSFTNAGLVPVKITATPSLGCANSATKNVRVYNKKVAFINYNIFKDTIQCLTGNYFDVDPVPVVSPLGASYRYNWDFGDNTFSSFKRMKKTYSASGTYNIQLEIISNVNTVPTGCKDTIRFKVQVLNNPAGGFNINKKMQCFKNNQFVFENPNNSIVSYKWYFSNGDSSATQQTVKSFTDTGKYRVIHVAKSVEGCFGRDTNFVFVKQNTDASFAALPASLCQSATPIALIPAVSGGVFQGYPNVNNQIVPNSPGVYKMFYIYTNSFCADSSEQDFEILPNPKPQLDKDTSICSGASYFINTNELGDDYLWNFGQTTPGINVSQTGQYIVKVTLGNCVGFDTINITFNTAPIILLGRDTVLCKGANFKLVANNANTNYIWNTGSTDSFIFVFNTGKYKLKASNVCGVMEDSINITIQSEYCDLFMVNAFSPNNDLINNVFMPRGRNITVKNFQIYNRWGELIFETDQNNVGWDGTFNGKDAEMGLFIWKLFYTVNNGPYIKKSNAFGNILLIR